MIHSLPGPLFPCCNSDQIRFLVYQLGKDLNILYVFIEFLDYNMKGKMTVCRILVSLF